MTHTQEVAKKIVDDTVTMISPTIHSLLVSKIASALEAEYRQGLMEGIGRGNIRNFQQSANPEQARKDFYGE